MRVQSEAYTPMKHFEVTGRTLPSRVNKSPKVYTMSVFAPNHVVARSKFFRLLTLRTKAKPASLLKVKGTRAEVLSIRRKGEKKPCQVKNFAIAIRARSATGIMNMTKEIRDVTLCGAVSQMFREMASRHRIGYFGIDIVSTAVRSAKEVKRPIIKQFLDPKIRFPLLHRVRSRLIRRSNFSATAPSTFA